MILSIAWKNIWRNKLRSLVVIIAMSFGLLSGIFAVALMNGFLLARVDTAIHNEVSSLQLHQTQYLDNSELEYTIPDLDEKIASISNMDNVAAVSKRLKIEGMLSSARAATGAVVIGIDPVKEKILSQISECILDSNGAYFEGVSRNPILISKKLAEKLKVRVRKSVVIQTVNKEGDITAENFKVVGIFKTENAMFDEMNVFVRNSDLQRVLGLGDNEAHEIAILTDEIMETDSLKKELIHTFSTYQVNEKSIEKAENDSLTAEMLNTLAGLRSDKIYSREEFESFMSSSFSVEQLALYGNQLYELCEVGIHVMDWKALAPDLELSIGYLDYMMVIFVGIILMALGFGIVNTMLMAVLERVKELGMLMAIGMNNLKVFAMIMIETILLCLTGGAIGIGLSLAILLPLMQTGIDFSSIKEGFESMGYASHIFPRISMDSYIQVVVMVIVTGVLASIYPALRAVKLNPAEAVRSE